MNINMFCQNPMTGRSENEDNRSIEITFSVRGRININYRGRKQIPSDKNMDMNKYIQNYNFMHQ
ncbi:hypothetical protein J27TS8_27190 [Robertmurraya siralis]|uniref:Uncharacterized protein n=1 Tax=Robertmurraya siralis TaxID=77777 RepID=A0A919WIM5_9BACI|nr:hypothetical protein J27TS8_27190 [Robertmurraya siralis]